MKQKMAPFWVLLVFGVLGILRIIGNPRLSTYYGPDVVSFVATGMLIGGAIGVFASSRIGRRSS
jgi:hypothetical protein